MEKSVKKNMILNMLRTFISIAFPLITYPYATRILQVENYGKVVYANSIISYFLLVAALGISTYAIREGALFRKSRDEFSKFASELFSINLFSTLISYVLYFVIFYIAFKTDNILLLNIFSLSIVFSTLSVEWINIIYEDYLYITVRSFIIQVISFILLIVLIKSPSDYYKYAILQVMNTGVIAFLNLFYIKKYCDLKITFKMNIKKHLKPIMILFSNSLAVSIYLNVDNVILGIIKGEYFVGIYSVAVKIYTILKQIVAAIYTVTVTRLTEYVSNSKFSDFEKLLNNVINSVIFISIPITFGIILTSKSIVSILAGKSYYDAYIPMNILVIAIIFAIIGGALAYCVNLPFKRESKNLKATIICALINLFSNFIAIPLWGVAGAALTTLISEFFVCVILFIGMHDLWRYFQFKSILVNFLKCLISSVFMIPISIIISIFVVKTSVLYLLLMIFSCSIEYFAISYFVKNDVMIDFVFNIKSRYNKIGKEICK